MEAPVFPGHDEKSLLRSQVGDLPMGQLVSRLGLPHPVVPVADR